VTFLLTEALFLAAVIILGGGTGGVVAANVLSKTLDKKHRIVLVDRKDSHVFQSSYPMTIVNKRNPRNITRKLDLLQKKGIDFIQAEVISVNQEQCNVQTDKGIIDYDYLIVSLGVEHHPETVPGFTDGAYNVYDLEDVTRLQDTLKGFKKGKIVLFISSIPFSCPPAPYEITFLLDAYFRERGIRDKVELSIIIPETSPEAHARPAVQKDFVTCSRSVKSA
jgi:sulfide:quinone oxidoreductase